MRVFALADPHLSLGLPGKNQDAFGAHWRSHAAKIAAGWRCRVTDDDLVLVAGDISWAMRMSDAEPDLRFLSALPGTKVLVRGNQDFCWKSLTKLRDSLPQRMIPIQANAVCVGPVVVCGTRLWDVPGVSFNKLINWRPPSAEPSEVVVSVEDVQIYERETARLRQALDDAARLRQETGTLETLVMTHYPPCDADLNDNELTRLFEQAGIRHVVFGHLHSLHANVRPFGEKNGVNYHLTACDYLDFAPVLITEVAS